MLIKNDKPLAAISYDTQTFDFLTKFVAQESTEPVIRISPEQFLAAADPAYQYINLVVRDFTERQLISKNLNQLGLDRWTYIGNDVGHPAHTIQQNKNLSIGLGCLIYPAVWAYSGHIGQDVIIHSMTRAAENVHIGDGSFLSGSITLAGGCKIGNRCFLGNNLFFMDGVSICDDVKLLPGTNLRKSITEPGTYYNPNVFKTENIVV
jgi:acetyltransferase-like isoleucine patch superfamily enzyme